MSFCLRASRPVAFAFLLIGVVLAIPSLASAQTGLTGSVRAVVASPSNGSILYAGTSDGVFKSLDAGANWSRIDSGLTYTDVMSLAIRPEAPCTIVAGIDSHVVNSNSGGSIIVNNVTDILAVSTDCGATWGVLPNGPAGRVARSLRFSSANPSVLYAALVVNGSTQCPSPCTDLVFGQIARATFASHEEVTVALTTTIVATDPADPCTSFTAASGTVYRNTSCATWDWAPVGNPGDLFGIVNVIRAHPTNHATLLAGTSAGSIYRKLDDANPWVEVKVVAGSITDIVYEPGSAQVAYAAGSAGVVYQTTDGGATWNQFATPGFSVQSLAISPAAPATVYAGGDVFVTNVGQAITRVIAISGNLDFGLAPIGGSPSRTLTITNSGNSNLTVSGIAYPAAFGGAWSGTILPGGHQDVIVTFSPSALALYGGTVTVTADQTSGTATATASGRGVSSLAADATADGKSDIFWRHNSRGEVWLWPMDGTTKLTETFVQTVADTNWEIRGVGDQNGDGKADLLWRNSVTGGIVFWPMNGAVPQSETFVATVEPAFDIVGTGDYNGDGKSDILWRNTINGQVWIWLMDGATALSTVHVDTVDLAYRIDGSGDVDGDGKSDIIWRNTVSGDVWVWLMDGTTVLVSTIVGTVPDLNYQIQGVADYTGDGKADILWRHATQGHVWLWPMDGAVLVSQTFVDTVDPLYTIEALGDYNGDGRSDILWYRGDTGDVWIWLMDGATRLVQAFISTVPDLGYRIVKVK
ncbi:MAG TPA: FG-GAP-like repeat-containing protein [Vicinamibacterales bacterium]|nr:FG-GAP-like repeat-containing protein [Vicinamibacterales bacterium]